MIVMTKAVSILVPDNLLPVLEKFLKRTPDMREAFDIGTLTLSTDYDVEADILLIPSLTSALQWGYDRQIHWAYAVTHASILLGRTAEIAARGDVAIIREQDLEARPNLVLETIAGRIGFSRGLEVENPHVPKSYSVASDDMPPKISPLRMYEEMPVRKDMWAHWPSYLFATDDSPASSPIDITGRARLLFSGPFIALPLGTWRIDIWFELTEDAVPYDYFIEIGGGDTLERTRYRPKAAGEQFIRMQHIVRDIRQFEIRVGLLRAAYHGELKLRSVWAVKLD